MAPENVTLRTREEEIWGVWPAVGLDSLLSQWGCSDIPFLPFLCLSLSFPKAFPTQELECSHQFFCDWRKFSDDFVSDPIFHGAAQLVHHNYWACALEPRSHKHWAHMQKTLKSWHSRVRAPQQEKPPWWATLSLQLESSSYSPQLEKSQLSNEDPAQPKLNKWKLF